MNTASHMESHGVPGTIQIARPIYELLKDRLCLRAAGSDPGQRQGRDGDLVSGRRQVFARSRLRTVVARIPTRPVGAPGTAGGRRVYEKCGTTLSMNSLSSSVSGNRGKLSIDML